MQLTVPVELRLYEMAVLLDVRMSDRKRRLFAVACLERFASQLADPRSRRALTLARRFADGRATEEERCMAEDAAFEAHAEMRQGRLGGETLVPWTWQGDLLTRAAALVVSQGIYYAEDAADYARRSLCGPGALWTEQDEEFVQCQLLRDIVGPQPPPVIEPVWLACNDGAAVHLARCILQEQNFTLLPILADALEDAGCTLELVLDHCRQPGLHVRGCWVVDAILGKS
jgi:hypothetical protein